MGYEKVMSESTSETRLWVASAHEGPYLVCGWAFVIAGAELRGRCGGARATSAGRSPLRALAEALKAVEGERRVRVFCQDDLYGALARGLKAPAGEPQADADLWSLIRAAAAGSLSFSRLPNGPDGPMIFCAAWAETGAAKAKAAGDFSAAIPRTNLARLALT